MDGARGVGRAVNKEERFALTAVLFYGCVRIVGAPMLLHGALYNFCIEVCSDFLHKTPLVIVSDAYDWRA